MCAKKTKIKTLFNNFKYALKADMEEKKLLYKVIILVFFVH